ncbi:MAG: cupredoxin domain-containing protein [Pseudomonadales bacterium]|nr:cupredoxin domain-containing protein [Pseudomonadales bacterium]
MNRQRNRLSVLLLSMIALFAGSACRAGELLAFPLNIANGHFDPQIIEVPAQTRFKLVITNHGPGPEEFESRELRKETVLAPGVTRAVVFAPLKPGTYSFFGEFHPDTAQGQIIVK